MIREDLFEYKGEVTLGYIDKKGRTHYTEKHNAGTPELSKIFARAMVGYNTASSAPVKIVGYASDKTTQRFVNPVYKTATSTEIVTSDGNSYYVAHLEFVSDISNIDTSSTADVTVLKLLTSDNTPLAVVTGISESVFKQDVVAIIWRLGLNIPYTTTGE